MCACFWCTQRHQIVVDAIDAFDGMEKLIVFAVDLDDVTSLTTYASSARIYRVRSTSMSRWECKGSACVS